MKEKKPPRVSVAIYMSVEMRETLRQRYGEVLANGYSGNEQCFLFNALLDGVEHFGGQFTDGKTKGG